MSLSLNERKWKDKLKNNQIAFVLLSEMAVTHHVLVVKIEIGKIEDFFNSEAQLKLRSSHLPQFDDFK